LPDEDAFGRTSAISSIPDGTKTLDTVQVTAGPNGSLYVWNPSTRQWGYGDSVVIDATSGKIMYSKPIPGYAKAGRTDGYNNQVGRYTGQHGRAGGALPVGPLRAGYVSSLSNQSDSIMNTIVAVSASNTIRSSNVKGTSRTDAFGKAIGVASTSTGALKDASEIWNIGAGVKLKYSMPLGYTEAFVNSGGRLAPMLAQPALIGAEFSTGSKFLKNADLVMDLQSVGKVVKPIAGYVGPVSLAYEGIFQTDWNDKGDIGHLGVGTGVLVVGAIASAPVALAVGVVWGVSDYFVQDYTYQGQKGWRALGKSHSDTMQKVYALDPDYFNGPKL
jgi:hypothetical protein